MEKYVLVIQAFCAVTGAWISAKLGFLGLALIILFSVMGDYIIIHIASSMGIEVTAKALFALLVAVRYILNVLLSIIENAGRMGADISEWLRKYMTVLKEGVDNKNDSGKAEGE